MVAGRPDEALGEVTREAAVPTPEARKSCLPAGCQVHSEGQPCLVPLPARTQSSEPLH